jgi:hypothetical protein
MLDLNEVQASIGRWHGLNTQAAMALVAELRAAREARDEIDRLYEDDRILLGEDERLLQLLATWDKATGEAT